jgi:hypothetical protein
MFSSEQGDVVVRVCVSTTQAREQEGASERVRTRERELQVQSSTDSIVTIQTLQDVRTQRRRVHVTFRPIISGRHQRSLTPRLEESLSGPGVRTMNLLTHTPTHTHTHTQKPFLFRNKRMSIVKHRSGTSQWVSSASRLLSESQGPPHAAYEMTNSQLGLQYGPCKKMNDETT